MKLKWLCLVFLISGCKSTPTFDLQQTYYKTDTGFIVKSVTTNDSIWLEFKITEIYETD